MAITTALSDEKIVALVLKGRIDDFTLLIDRYQKLIFVIALKYAKDPDEAKSLSSDIFFAVYRGLPSYGNGSFKAWISRIAINKCNDWARKKARERAKNIISIEEYPKEILSTVSLPEEELLRKEDARTLKKLISTFPEKYRRVIYLNLIEGRTACEIAEIEGENQKTIESRLRRAKEQLRKHLREGMKDGG